MSGHLSVPARVRRFLLPALAAVTVAAALVPSAASASSLGYSVWGGFGVNVGGQHVGIPQGYETHSIRGSGQWVSSDYVSFLDAGTLCDPAVKFVYGYGSEVVSGGIHYGCLHFSQWTGLVNAWAPRGTACAQLYADDWRVFVTQQCAFVQ